jgi:DNA mismatch repair protein MutS
MSIVKDYINYHNKYEKIYGINKSIVFMQIGGFFEAYGTNDVGPDLINISKITGVTRSKKNKISHPEVSLEHPYMLGFPLISLIKFTEMLLENDYVIIVIEQVVSDKTDKKKKEERKVTNIYSKGTYIENLEKKDGNFICCVYFSMDPQKDHSSLLSVGIAATDVSIGHTYIHEAYSTKYDTNFALDEADRFINSIDPKEILIYYIDSKNNDVISKKKAKDLILSYLKLNDDCRYFDTIDNKYTKLGFQNEMLGKVYPSSKSLITPIEQLNLERNLYALVSLVLIFDFIYDKNTILLHNLKKPTFYINTKHLTLGNNAIRQLDILENYNNNSKCKYKSLFHVLNKTSTALGERFLKNRLLSPLIDSTELNETYDLIDNMIKKDFYKQVENYLENIRDIERLERKIKLQILRPFEIYHFVNSYENIYDLINIISKGKSIKKIQNILPSEKNIKKCKKFLDYIEKIFNMDELNKYSNMDMKTNVFNDDIYTDIDDITKNVDQAHTLIEDLRATLDELVKQKSKQSIHIKKNNRDGFYLSLTNLKANALKTILKTKTEIKVGTKTIKTSLLEFKDAGKSTKIYFPSLDQKSDDIEKYNDELQALNRKYFLKELVNIDEEFSDMFASINKFIATIDFIKSSSKVACEYGYTRPKLIEHDSGYVNAIQIRHPIIERIIDYEYIPHDIELGKDLKGMLLYGLNSSGKSSSMKALGLSVIMAQSGLFVPAKEFILSPYHSLYTRITGDDNIFRGLSSYALEMVEVNAILKRTGKHTLVIGDEVCRGTEHISGNAIVAATIIKLAKTDSSFIFATHLHEIMTLKDIKELKTVKAFHIHVGYDEKTDTLIYDREMKEGSGDPIYGITVARHIIQDTEFIDKAMEIKNELMQSYNNIISGKTSKYNTNIFMYECHLCGKKDTSSHLSNLETHHINFQKDCENGLVKTKKHIKKNHESNLIVLCNDCHDKIHAGKIVLDKYVLTSKGKTILMKDK